MSKHNHTRTKQPKSETLWQFHARLERERQEQLVVEKQAEKQREKERKLIEQQKKLTEIAAKRMQESIAQSEKARKQKEAARNLAHALAEQNKAAKEKAQKEAEQKRIAAYQREREQKSKRAIPQPMPSRAESPEGMGERQEATIFEEECQRNRPFNSPRFFNVPGTPSNHPRTNTPVDDHSATRAQFDFCETDKNTGNFFKPPAPASAVATQPKPAEATGWFSWMPNLPKLW